MNYSVMYINVNEDVALETGRCYCCVTAVFVVDSKWVNISCHKLYTSLSDFPFCAEVDRYVSSVFVLS